MSVGKEAKVNGNNVSVRWRKAAKLVRTIQANKDNTR